MTRFVVFEQATPEAVRTAVTALAADRAEVVSGWHPTAGRPTVCVGTVASAADAADAVLAAVGGARLVISADAPREVVDRMCDDLRRLGALDHRPGPAEPSELTEEEAALLALLLGGATLGEAARHLHLSRRTADRRLASARAAFGARGTAEALSRAMQHGIRPAQLPPSASG